MRSSIPNSRNQTTRQLTQPNPSEAINPLQDRFLAITEARKNEVAYLRPLHYWRESKWKEHNDLPTIPWRSAPPSVRIGSLWIIRLVGDDKTDTVFNEDSGDKYSDTYQVCTSEGTAPEAVVEAFIEKPKKTPNSSKRPSLHMKTLAKENLSLEEIFSELEDLRHMYFDMGKALGFVPQEVVYLCVQKRFALGPITLAYNETTGCWKPVADFAYVPVSQCLTEGTYTPVDIRGVPRVILRDSSPSLRRIGVADFRADDIFLQEFISEQSDPRADTPLILTALQELKARPQERTVYQCRRIEEMLNGVLANQGLHAEVGKLLIELPSAKTLLSEHLASVRTDAEKRFEEEFHAASSEAKRLREETDELAKVKAKLEAESEAIIADLVRLRSEKTEETEKRIADIAAAVTLNLSSLSTNAPSSSFVVSTPQSPLKPVSDAAEADENQAARYLKKRLKALGIDPEAAEAFLAALITGVTPVIVGPAASTLLGEFEGLLFGGYAVRRTITPLMVECSDLFGKVHAASGTFRPDSDGLADMLLTANSDKLHLVSFDGFNRCEYESVFPPILTMKPHAIPIIRPGAIRPDDPYVPLAAKVWPNTFISTFRYSADGVLPSIRFWAQSATVVASFLACGEQAQEVKSLFLTPRYITELTQKAKAQRATAVELISRYELQGITEWLGRFGRDATGYLAALLSLGVDERRAGGLMVQSLAAISMLQSGTPLADEAAERAKRCREALDYA